MFPVSQLGQPHLLLSIMTLPAPAHSIEGILTVHTYVVQLASPFNPFSTQNASLTRSCVFFGEGGTAGTPMEKGAFYREGMVGVSLTGDIRMRSFVSQGARRVGPTFNADKVLIRYRSELLIAVLLTFLRLCVPEL